MAIDLKKCAIHTMTNKPWTLAQCCERYAAAGIGGISVWRNVIEPIGIAESARIIGASGLKVPALVRGGFFPATDAQVRSTAEAENKRCIDEAAAIGAEMVVLVVGISLLGYIALKLYGERAGVLIAGLVGGVVSSTATTVSVSTPPRVRSPCCTRSARPCSGSPTAAAS